MVAVIQVKRRIGTAGAPSSLAPGELAFSDFGGATRLYAGTSPAAVVALVSDTRQVEIAGAQTITGDKTIAVANLHISGGLSGQILSTNGSGGLSWISVSSPLPSNANPIMDGVAAPGINATYSRDDHVHPTDTSRAPLNSPALTGTPTAPTATPGTNTTQIATTAFVDAASPDPSTTNPVMDGTAAVGVSLLYSRQDHVHPSDTSRVPMNGGTMTGLLILSGPPGVANGAATKQYVDQAAQGANLWQGVYNPATNTPDLTQAGVQNNGWSWTVNVAGNTIVTLPGIPSGTTLNAGDVVQYVTASTQYFIISSANLTQAEADARYVTLTTAQTITGAKTISTTNFKLTGGANTNVLTTDGLGNVSWTAAPGGGITSVSHDTTMTGDGNTTPLSVASSPILTTARTIGITATGGTTITATAASFNGSSNVNITGFEVTGLDGGTY